MSADKFWLGMTSIQQQVNRVALPESVLQMGVADTDAAVFWAYDTEEDVVLLSRLRDEFTENDRFTHLGDAQVTESRVAAVPQEVMDEYSGFDFGEQLYFVTTTEYAEKDMCMVLPEDMAQDRFDGFDDLRGGEK